MNRKFSLGSVGLMAGVVATAATGAHAYLGGFESADGYQPFLNMVQNYNAGHYGPNGGYGGGPSAITPNTDFWTAVSGGFFSGGQVSYATGHQNFDRLWINNSIGSPSNQALQLTTNHLGWNGPSLEYTYKVDAPDLGGVAPSSTPGTTVKISLWWRGNLNGADTGGFVPEGFFGNAIQFRDSSNNVGFEFGMTQRSAGGDKVTYWNGSTLFESAMPNPSFKYDRWDVTLDLANNTVSADFFQFNTSTLNTLFTNVPMMTPMNDFSILDFRTGPGVTNDKFYGMCVDDFAITVVPEPGTIGAIALIGGVMLLRRPRRT